VTQDANSNIIPFVPKIISDPGERVDPSVLSFIMQASMAAQIARMRQIQEDTIPTGYISYSITVTDATYKMSLLPYWISFHMVNDDATYDLYWSINDEGDLLTNAPITAHDEFDIDFERPMIHTIFLKAPTGQSLSVRIFGIQG